MALESNSLGFVLLGCPISPTQPGSFSQGGMRLFSDSLRYTKTWRLERLCPLLPTLAGTILPLHLIAPLPIPHPHFLFVFGSLFQSSRHHVCTRTDTHTESEYLLFTSFTHTQVLWPPNLNSIWHLSTWNKVPTRSISLVPSLTSRKQNPIG